MTDKTNRPGKLTEEHIEDIRKQHPPFEVRTPDVGVVMRELRVPLSPEQVKETGQDIDNFHADKDRRNEERAGFEIGDKVRIKPGQLGCRWGVGVIEAIEGHEIGIAFEPAEDFKGLSWRAPDNLDRVSVGWLATYDNNYDDVLAEMVWAPTRTAAIHQAVNAFGCDWEDSESEFFEIKREPRLDEFAGIRRVPAAVERAIGLMEEGCTPCDSCGLGMVFDPKTKDHIGEVCEVCAQCDDCGCACCPMCKEEDSPDDCPGCCGSGDLADYKRLRRLIRLKDNGEFEGLVWEPGQTQLGYEYHVTYPADLLSAAVKAYAKSSGAKLIFWEGRLSMHLASVVAEALFVQENPDGSITLRGRLLSNPRGEAIRGMWEAQRPEYGVMPEGVVPWSISGRGTGRTDTGGVCEELNIEGFDLVES